MTVNGGKWTEKNNPTPEGKNNPTNICHGCRWDNHPVYPCRKEQVETANKTGTCEFRDVVET